MVSSDHTQPEGFQFAIEGIALTKAKIKKGHIDFKNTKQVPTNLCRKEGLKNIVFGCGFYNNSFSSKEKSPISQDFLLKLVVEPSKYFHLKPPVVFLFPAQTSPI